MSELSKILPEIRQSEQLTSGVRRLYIGTYGFEDRSLGWVNHRINKRNILSDAIIVRYSHPKGRNKIQQMNIALQALGVSKPREIKYDLWATHSIEETLLTEFGSLNDKYDEIVIDISAMTKFLVLVSLCYLSHYRGSIRVVYSEANHYPPSPDEFNSYKAEMAQIVGFPSYGVEMILRATCLSSIRMQGQPVTMVAFTSFNEQLIRHMLGTINPHRLILINGQSPRLGYEWREAATQEIHESLIEEYTLDNALDSKGVLKSVTSTLDYRETVTCIDDIYKEHGMLERIICVASGSKMQTLGLFFSKIRHPDIHIEYPTPDSYLMTGNPTGVKMVHELVFEKYADDLKILGNRTEPRHGGVV